MSEKFKAGLYQDVNELEYHARKFGPAESLSSTEAKNILRAPAYFKWVRENGQEHNPAFDFGHLVHALVLGTGLDLYIHDHESLRTKAAREDVEAAREDGMLPVSRWEYQEARTLADTVLAHPVARELFEQDGWQYEVSGYCKVFDGWMRGRFDAYNPDAGLYGYMESWPLIVDLKTAQSAQPEEFMRNVMNYGYDLQLAWYKTICEQTTGVWPEFFHIVVEKKPPYLCSVIKLDSEFERIGVKKMNTALSTYARCMAKNEWPGYGEHWTVLEPPEWYLEKFELDEIEVN